MNIQKLSNDAAILSELGKRLGRARLDRNWTQAQLAEAAGVSKRTVERLEAGESAQLSSLIRLCRALGLLGNLDAIIPEIAPSPIAQLKLRGKDRKRASSRVKGKTPGRGKKWEWGTEP